MSLKIKLTYLILLSSLITITNKILAETLSISTPYLPSKIQILGSEDLVTNVILSNISTQVYTQNLISDSPTKPIKTSRIKEKDSEIWEILYPSEIPITSSKKFDSTIIKNSITFFKEYLNTQELVLSDQVRNSIKNISEITFNNSPDGFLTKFKLKNSDPSFLNSLSMMPIIDNNSANILGLELGKGNNLPLYGNFQIKEVLANSYHTLVRNNNFGLKSEQDAIQEIILRKLNNSESRMRAIRSGSVAIILAPSLKEIEDAKSDPTLDVIISPFAKRSYKMLLEDKNDLDRNEIYDLQHLIIRKSLKTDNNFINFFELHSVILSVV